MPPYEQRTPLITRVVGAHPPRRRKLTRARVEDSDKPTPTASTLHRLFGTRSVPEQAVFLLTLFNREQDALSVGQDPLADDDARILALRRLARSGWEDKVLPILRAIGHDPARCWLRFLAAHTLIEFGQSDEARSILLTLAKDPADTFTRDMAARGLADHGWLDDVQVLEPILSDSLNRGLFGMHVWTLIKTGRLSELPGLAADDDFGVSVRKAIASELANLARGAEYGYASSGEEIKPSLRAIAQDHAVDDQIRGRAAMALAELGERDTAVPILRELVGKQEFDASERVTIASVLAKLEHVDEVIPVLHELEQAVGVSSSVRIQACATLQ
jgi:thioredoxin-like negative regulator of GroEL